MKKSLFLALIGTIAFFVFAGCSTTGGLNVLTTATVAKIAAKDASYYALSQNPGWREEFVLAYNEISALANQERIDVATLSAIIQRLPVKELKSTTARILISDVQIIVEQITPLNGQIVSSDKYADPRIVITAIRDGMKIALDMTEPVP